MPIAIKSSVITFQFEPPANHKLTFGCFQEPPQKLLFVSALQFPTSCWVHTGMKQKHDGSFVVVWLKSADVINTSLHKTTDGRRFCEITCYLEARLHFTRFKYESCFPREFGINLYMDMLMKVKA